MPFALLSVSDKSGLLELARGLLERGWELIASGGTADHLRKAGLPCRDVSHITHSPELLDGRVKTLHPTIYAGILSRRTPSDCAELAADRVRHIDLVAVNLYPFEATVARGASQAETLEQIDIGGVSLLRAAAKNFEHVWVLSDPADYPRVLADMDSSELRRQLAGKAFALTSAYDEAIGAYMTGTPLRYGENPHQKARLDSPHGPLGGELLAGKELSYNNLLDLDAAWRAVEGFTEPSVVVVKHVSPCGAATADTLPAAVRQAIDCDPISAFGGIIAANRLIEADFVAQLGDLFLECLVAPDFTPAAREALKSRKNLRLLRLNGALPDRGEVRSVRGGRLWQERDDGQLVEADWKVVTRRQPTEAEMESLRFAWRVCQHVRSNAIVLASGTVTVGIGGGQPNRVDSLRIALKRATGPAQVLASDAFFPFADSLALAAEAGIAAVIQPGGSVRDQESIDFADSAGMAMIFTGRRHFRH